MPEIRKKLEKKLRKYFKYREIEITVHDPVKNSWSRDLLKTESLDRVGCPECGENHFSLWEDGADGHLVFICKSCDFGLKSSANRERSWDVL